MGKESTQTGEASPENAAGLGTLAGLMSQLSQDDGGSGQAKGVQKDPQAPGEEPEGTVLEGQEPEAGSQELGDGSQEPEAGSQEPEGDGGKAEGEDGQGDGDGDGGGEGEDEPEGLTPEAQHAFNARIAKEVAKRKGLQEAKEAAIARTKELEAELTELRQSQELAGHDLEHDFAGLHPEVREVRKAEAEALAVQEQARTLLRKLNRAPEEVAQWLTEHKINAGETPEDQQEWLERVHDNAQAKANRLGARRANLEEKVLQSQAQVTQQANAQAEAAYPELKDTTSAMHQEVQSLIRQVPWLRQLPSHKLMVADMIAGREARKKAAMGKSAKAAPMTKTPPKSEPGTPTHKPAPVDNAKARAAAAQKRHLTNPTVDSLTALLNG